MVEAVKAIAKTLPGYINNFSKINNTTAKFALSKSSHNLKVENIIENLDKFKDDFHPEEMVSLIISLGKIYKFYDCKHNAELLYFNLFRRNETDLDKIPSSDIILLLKAFRNFKMSNKLILGYLALEWSRRLERMSDLQLQAIRVPRKNRSIKKRKEDKALMHGITTHYFDISSACLFMNLLGLMKINDSKSVNFLRSQFEEHELIKVMGHNDLIGFISAYNMLKDIKSVKIRGELMQKLQTEKETILGLKNNLLKGNLLLNLVKMRTPDTEFINDLAVNLLADESLSEEFQMNYFFRVFAIAVKSGISLPPSFNKRVNFLIKEKSRNIPKHHFYPLLVSVLELYSQKTDFKNDSLGQDMNLGFKMDSGVEEEGDSRPKKLKKVAIDFTDVVKKLVT